MKKILFVVITLLMVPISASAQWVDRGSGSALGTQAFDLQYCSYRLSLAGCVNATSVNVSPVTIDLTTKSSTLSKASVTSSIIVMPGIESTSFNGGDSSTTYDIARLKNGIACGWFSSIPTATLSADITAGTQILGFMLVATRLNLNTPQSFRGTPAVIIKTAAGVVKTLKVDPIKAHLFENCN